MKKLTLSKETIRQLTVDEILGVAGGEMHVTTTVQPTRVNCLSVQAVCPTPTAQHTHANCKSIQVMCITTTAQ